MSSRYYKHLGKLRHDSRFTEREVDRDLGFDVYGIPVQQVWPVFPLLDGIEGGRRQHGVTREEFDAYDVARAID